MKLICSQTKWNHEKECIDFVIYFSRWYRATLLDKIVDIQTFEKIVRNSTLIETHTHWQWWILKLIHTIICYRHTMAEESRTSPLCDVTHLQVHLHVPDGRAHCICISLLHEHSFVESDLVDNQFSHIICIHI